MKNFVPVEKMSKRAQRELAKKRRGSWLGLTYSHSLRSGILPAAP